MRILLPPGQSLTETQSERVGQLHRTVAAITDGLGSENTDSEQVLLVAQRSFVQARLATFPAGYLFKRFSAASPTER